MSLSSHLTILIQRQLRCYFTDSSLAALVFTHELTGYYSIYLTSLYLNRYANKASLYQVTSTIIGAQGFEVQKIDFVVPQEPDLGDPSFWLEVDLDRWKCLADKIV